MLGLDKSVNANVEPPALVSYAITQKCNLHCKHCYSDAAEDKANDELSLEQSKRLLDQIGAWGIKLLILDGGEPLCSENFLEMVNYAVHKGLRTTVGSNGTMIDYSTAVQMKQAGVAAIAISVDGATAETHDSLRGEQGSFEKALRGAEACRKAQLPFQFGMVIRKSSYKEVPDMLKLAIDSGAFAAEFFDLIQVKRVRSECADEVLSLEERKSVMEWLAEAQRSSPLPIKVVACPMYPLILKERNVQPTQLPQGFLRRVPYWEGGCAAGRNKGYITILSNGDVIPCMLLQARLGNVKNQDIRDIWANSPILQRLRRRELLQGKCGACEYRVQCGGCRGRAYEEKGDILAEDPGCWIK